MRLERYIIGVLSVICLCLGIYYGWTVYRPVLVGTSDHEIRFLVPSAAGIRLGQNVIAIRNRAGESAGTVTGMQIASTGIMISVEIDENVRLSQDARAIVGLVGASRPAVIELMPGEREDNPLPFPALIPCEIHQVPPEDMLEPAPRAIPLDFNTGRAGTASAESYLIRGILAFQERNYDSAILHGRNALALEPFNVEIRLFLAESFGRNGRFAEAFNALEFIRPIATPGILRVKVLASQGTAALSLGLLSQARELLFEAYSNHDDSMDTLLASCIAFNLAITWKRSGDPDQALVFLDRHRLHDMDANLLRAGAMDMAGHSAEAMALLEAASAISPVAALNYAILLRKNGMIDRSITVFEELEESWKEEALVAYHFAKSLEAVKKLKEAQEHYMEAARLEKDPELSEIFRLEAQRLQEEPH